MTAPTLDQIVAAIESVCTTAKISRDGETVVAGYGSTGYLRLTPSTIIRDGQELPAARIDGRLSRRDGGTQAELRSALRAAGIEIR